MCLVCRPAELSLRLYVWTGIYYDMHTDLALVWCFVVGTACSGCVFNQGVWPGLLMPAHFLGQGGTQRSIKLAGVHDCSVGLMCKPVAGIIIDVCSPAQEARIVCVFAVSGAASSPASEGHCAVLTQTAVCYTHCVAMLFSMRYRRAGGANCIARCW
jgi:hypothetical protein